MSSDGYSLYLFLMDGRALLHSENGEPVVEYYFLQPAMYDWGDIDWDDLDWDEDWDDKDWDEDWDDEDWDEDEDEDEGEQQ